MRDKQEKIPHYIFVCFANAERSPTAERVCKDFAKKYNLEIKISSAGISDDTFRPLTEEKVKEADKIFVMESYMKDFILKEYGKKSQDVINLKIPDIYSKENPELVMFLEEGIMEWLRFFHDL